MIFVTDVGVKPNAVLQIFVLKSWKILGENENERASKKKKNYRVDTTSKTE